MWANNVMGLRRMTHISKCSRVVMREKIQIIYNGIRILTYQDWDMRTFNNFNGVYCLCSKRDGKEVFSAF